MPEKYFYNGHLRWTLFWENPNCWAAFLACLLAWIWCGQSVCLKRADRILCKIAIIALYIAETGIWSLLVKTYSRGGLVAAVVAMMFFFILHGLRGTGCQPVNSGSMGILPMNVAQAAEPAGSSSMGILPMKIWRALRARSSSHVAGTTPAGNLALPETNPTGKLPVPPSEPAGSAACATATGWKPVLLGILIRVALVAIICIAAGFASRMSPDYVTQDRSVLNRFDLWKGAMVMTSDSPFNGWGSKLGGIMYQNWYQPLSHTTRPVGFVNSYLEVAVEQGSHVLFFIIVCASALLLIAISLRRVTWGAAAGASLVAWLACNLSSSLWFRPGLWVLPAIAMLFIIVTAFLEGRPSRRSFSPKVDDTEVVPPTLGTGIKMKSSRILAISLTVGIIVWILIIGAGRMLAKNFPFQAMPAASGDAAIVARRGYREKPLELRTELWVDAAVTGRYWGKSIRTIIENKDYGSFIVYAPWALRSNRLEQAVGKYVYSGFQIELAGKHIETLVGRAVLPKPSQTVRQATPANTTTPIIILHPTIYPPAANPASWRDSEIVVCLPEIDVSAYSLPWRLWAAENNAKLVFSPQSVTRINPNDNRDFWRSLVFNE